MKYTVSMTPVQLGQAVKSLVQLGEKKITINVIENDSFVVTTQNETAASKKAAAKTATDVIIPQKGEVFNA